MLLTGFKKVAMNRWKGLILSRIHPLAGQGVNLGWRDVEFLTKCLETAINDGGDLGSINYLKDYDTKAQRRNSPIIASIDFLNHLYTTEFKPYIFLRSHGINFVDRCTPIKDLIIRLAS